MNVIARKKIKTPNSCQYLWILNYCLYWAGIYEDIRLSFKYLCNTILDRKLWNDSHVWSLSSHVVKNSRFEDFLEPLTLNLCLTICLTLKFWPSNYSSSRNNNNAFELFKNSNIFLFKMYLRHYCLFRTKFLLPHIPWIGQRDTFGQS